MDWEKIPLIESKSIQNISTIISNNNNKCIVSFTNPPLKVNDMNDNYNKPIKVFQEYPVLYFW